MDKKTVFSYTYSASDNHEVQNIRKKYFSEETKLDELRRLDREVSSAGTLLSLILGICGVLVFGIGFCMVMKVIGGGVIWGLIIGALGTVIMIPAYPVKRRLQSQKKAELLPRIRQLSDELMSESK